MVVIALALGVLASTWLLSRFGGGANREPENGLSNKGSSGSAVRTDVNRSRRAYPFSVIVGGAYSGGELRVAREFDPVVARHYDVFGRSVSVLAADRDLYMFVSYRKSNSIYWTKKAHRIPKGELLLTDGEHLARTRCGNRLSAVPQLPVSAGDEPTEAAFNAPPPPERLPEPKIDVPELEEVNAYTPPPLSTPVLEEPTIFAEAPKGTSIGVSTGTEGGPIGGTPLPGGFVAGIPLRFSTSNPGGGGGSVTIYPITEVPGSPSGNAGPLSTPEPPMLLLLCLAAPAMIAGIRIARRSGLLAGS